MPGRGGRWLVLLLLVGQLVPVASAGETDHRFVAFSLREAARCARSDRPGDEVLQLGGIGRIAGIVVDRQGGDAVLVGLRARSLRSGSLDELVVALRARMVYGEWPVVSIDPMEDTERTRLQHVRFDGHLDNTAYGKEFLDCDILLKRCCLELSPVVPQVPPYKEFVEKDVTRRAVESGTQVRTVRWYSSDEGARLTEIERGSPVLASDAYQARFWFYVQEPYTTTHREDVFCIKELALAVKVEGQSGDAPSLYHKAQDDLAATFSEHLAELYDQRPVLGKLKMLYDLVAVAEALTVYGKPPYLQYFLDEYVVKKVPTEATHKLDEIYGLAERSDGVHHLVRISGGVELRTEVRLLNYGDVTPLRLAVLGSRPSSDALSWELPLDGWDMPNAQDLDLQWVAAGTGVERGRSEEHSDVGCSVLCQSVVLQPDLAPTDEGVKRFFGFPPPPPPPPPLRGVSMRMVVSTDSFRAAPAGSLDQLRRDLLKGRSGEESPTWQVPTREDTNRDRDRGR